MLRIGVVKTASGAKAVQVIYYHNRKRKIFKHIGSANSESELADLKSIALDLINSYSRHYPLKWCIETAARTNLQQVDRKSCIYGNPCQSYVVE